MEKTAGPPAFGPLLTSFGAGPAALAFATFAVLTDRFKRGALHLRVLHYSVRAACFARAWQITR